MKTIFPYIISLALVAVGAAEEPVGDADFKAGYAVGKVQGEEWASLGQNMPLSQGLELIAIGQASRLGPGVSVDRWRTGFKAGYANGFSEAKANWRPSTADNEKYHQPSYWAGYKAGFKGARLDGDERTRFLRGCDLDIQTRHYIKSDYDAGFRAGEADSDKQEEQKKAQQAEIERKAFEKRSYEAGYRSEKKLHKHNGIPQTIEESIELNREAQKWDAKSWAAGWRTANEEDTRP
jgi:hypothetical protein